MTPFKHCKISRKRWGGAFEDYLPIHEFIDSTKVLCADNRHRVLHTHWAIDHIVLPLFGRTFVNSEGHEVIVKELVEQDHILPDYRYQFIPTLGDFVSSMNTEITPNLSARIERFHTRYCHSDISQILLSPLAATGQLASLLITHNSWFINSVVPKLLPCAPYLENFDISPDDLFGCMQFELWMDNGADLPPSAIRHGQSLAKSA